MEKLVGAVLGRECADEGDAAMDFAIGSGGFRVRSGGAADEWAEFPGGCSDGSVWRAGISDFGGRPAV